MLRGKHHPLSACRDFKIPKNKLKAPSGTHKLSHQSSMMLSCFLGGQRWSGRGLRWEPKGPLCLFTEDGSQGLVHEVTTEPSALNV